MKVVGIVILASMFLVSLPVLANEETKYLVMCEFGSSIKEATSRLNTEIAKSQSGTFKGIGYGGISFSIDKPAKISGLTIVKEDTRNFRACVLVTKAN